MELFYQLKRWYAYHLKRGYGLRFIAILLVFYSQQGLAQYADCSSAIIVRGNTQPFNPSGVGTNLEQLACGGIEHNSVWIAFQAKASGKLNFVIRPFTPSGLPTSVDVDWSLYSLTGAPGAGTCNTKTQLSCNFAGSATVFGIPGATGLASPNYVSSTFNPGIDVVNGNWYVLMLDQFSNTTPLLFSVQFTGNPESENLNSTPGIFDDRPNFNITTNPSCNGAYSFTNTSTATTGIASYLWDFGDGSTSTLTNPNHTYATPGNYFVTLSVFDNNGFRTDIRKPVTYNSGTLTMNTSGILATSSCTDANNGVITVVTTGAGTLGISGGTPPYTYELVSPSAMIRPSQSSNIFTGLQPGGYTIKATDACGQSATGVTTVTQTTTNAVMALGLQNVQSACVGTATGTATVSATGTVPPYTLALVNSSPVTTAAFTAVQRDPLTGTYFVTFTNLLPGLYTVEGTDGCGKIRRATFTVTPSTAPIATTVASASCTTSPTGSLTVTATGSNGLTVNGSPGIFQYALIAPSPIIRPFQNGSVFENLWPGTYTIAVRDACGNLGTATATVGVAGNPSFGTNFTTASCPNSSTATMEVQLGSGGGGAPYTYELIAPSPVTRPAQNSNTFLNLAPGTYTIRLTDVCGTAITTNTTVSAASAPTFTTTLVASCGTPQNGSITVTPSASSLGPYTFALISPGAAIRPPQGSNIANSVNSIFTELGQGFYSIRMTDVCGGEVTNTATITAPSVLTFPSGSTTLASCSASSTGAIIVAVPSTGRAPYQYELIAPSPLIQAPQSGRVFNNLPAGSYTVRITDACGTQVTIGTPITVGTSTAPTLSATNTASCATASGTITALATTANQGGGTYQFSLIAPSPVTRPNQSSPIFTGLDAGAYTVQIMDQCGATGTTTTTIAAAGAFSPAAGASIASCSGGGYVSQIIVTTPQNFTTGGFIPTGSGGGPYTYAVYDATNTTLIAGPQSSNVFSNITPVAGNPSHTIRVTDVCGNTSTVTLAVNPPATLANATLAAITASCASANTGVMRLSTTSSGGLPPYQYSLIDATTSAVVMGPQSSTTFNLVPANATGYFVRTTDACGSVTTTTTAVLFPAAVTPTATTAVTASCASSATGRILVTPGIGSTLAGGTFSYELYDATNTTLVMPSQSSPLFTNVAAATYTVRITDRCGTVGTATATVSSTVTALTAAGTATNTCTGGSNGVITGGFGGGSLPITYSLVDQATSTVIAGPQSNNIFTGLVAGTYNVSVTDACGTVANSSNIVLGNLTAVPSLSTTVAVDCGGSAKISAYGGGGNGGPYTYAICTGAACTTFGAYTSNSQFTVNASGTYRISIADRCGNTSNSADIVVNIPTQAVINSVTKDIPCGPTTVTLSLSNVPNTPYYSVDGGNFAASIGTLAPGVHTILVADFNAGIFGCSSAPAMVTVGTTPVLTITSPAAVCAPGTVDLTAAGVTAGSTNVGTLSYWNDMGATSSLSNPNAVSVSNTYYIQADNAGCTDIEPVTVTVNGNATNVVAVNGTTWGADYEITDGSGWTHYYDDNGTSANYCDDYILLSLKKNGNAIGAIGDPGFAVEVKGAGGAVNITANSNYVQNPDWYVMNRYWDVTPTAQPTSDIDVRFYYTTADFDAVNNSSAPSVSIHTDLKFYKVNGNMYDPNPALGHAGIPSATTYDANGYWQYNNGPSASNTAWAYGTIGSGHYGEYVVASFSGGGGGGGGTGGAFPIELVSFTGFNSGTYNVLNWNTASEVNFSHFDVMRSQDGVVYENIGFVTGKGDENTSAAYTLLDYSPNLGVNYYQLRMVDKDGSHAFSNVVNVSLNKEISISLYPSPTSGDVNIETRGMEGVVVLKMANALGQEVLTHTWTIDALQLEKLDISALPKGVYFYEISNKGNTQQGRIILGE